MLGCVIESLFPDVSEERNVLFLLLLLLLLFEGKMIQKFWTPQPLKKKALRSFETRAIQSSQQESLIPQQNFTLNNTAMYT
jgi:hypothetical protein